MRTIETILYRFSELSETAQQKAIDKWYELETYDYLEDDILMQITECLDSKKVFSDIKLSYSLSYCQGDGLSFSADIDIDNFLAGYDFQQFKKSAIKQQFIFKLSAKNGNYPFASASQIEIEDNCSSFYFKSDLSNLEALVEKVLLDLKMYYLGVCKEAQKYGYAVIEYRMPVDEFSDLCEDNDYGFLIDGTLC